ncbi:MAG: hypothetical protein ACTHZ1_09675 [Sphingobacterium sp.]
MSGIRKRPIRIDYGFDDLSWKYRRNLRNDHPPIGKLRDWTTDFNAYGRNFNSVSVFDRSHRAHCASINAKNHAQIWLVAGSKSLVNLKRVNTSHGQIDFLGPQ